MQKLRAIHEIVLAIAGAGAASLDALFARRLRGAGAT